jgi:hypothetical protein
MFQGSGRILHVLVVGDARIDLSQASVYIFAGAEPMSVCHDRSAVRSCHLGLVSAILDSRLKFRNSGIRLYEFKFYLVNVLP